MTLSLTKRVLTSVVILIVIINSCWSKKQPPHVIFILADDLGWNDIAFHGETEIPTPNIDALGADGIILNNYYVTPLCTPSRASLMTGLYPASTGLQNSVIDDAGPWALPLEFPIFPEYMRDLGYTARMVGKWHLGFYRSEYTPTQRGFQSHYGFWGSSVDLFTHTGISNHKGYAYEGVPESLQDQNVIFNGLDFRDDFKVVKNRQQEYLTDVFTEKAEEVIREHNKSTPLYLYLAHHGVHRGNWFLPVRSPPKYNEGFDFITNHTRQQFAGAVTAVDQSVGRIFKTLQEEGMLENSIICFSTDNGADHATFTSNAGSNYPLRGQKFTNWEGGVRGVGLIWSPLLRRNRRVSTQMMHISDWLPTIYHAAGGDPENLHHLDGVDMWDALSENLPSPRNITLINVDPIYKMGALRVGDYKILYGSVPFQDLNSWYGPTARSAVAPHGFRSDSEVATVLKDYYDDYSLTFKPKILSIKCGNKPKQLKYQCNPNSQPCLFNIKQDPCEYRNIAGENQIIYGQMLDLLENFNRTAYPPLNRALSYSADPLLHDGLWESWADINGPYLF